MSCPSIHRGWHVVWPKSRYLNSCSSRVVACKFISFCFVYNIRAALCEDFWLILLSSVQFGSARKAQKRPKWSGWSIIDIFLASNSLWFKIFCFLTGGFLERYYIHLGFHSDALHPNKERTNKTSYMDPGSRRQMRENCISATNSTFGRSTP